MAVYTWKVTTITIDIAQYTYLKVKQLFMELFCTIRTGIADPIVHFHDYGRKRTRPQQKWGLKSLHRLKNEPNEPNFRGASFQSNSPQPMTDPYIYI